MESIFNSFLLVAATEMGDKTQILALLLATRFRKPLVIIFGIFVATVLNHLVAAYFGSWIVDRVSPQIISWFLCLTFIGFAIWVLFPDKDSGLEVSSKYGAFLTTTVAFFLAEMGDKTQLATVALAAKYHSIVSVTIGTTAGMLAADGAAVFFGDRLTQVIPLKWMRILSSIIFILLAIGIFWAS